MLGHHTIKCGRTKQCDFQVMTVGKQKVCVGFQAACDATEVGVDDGEHAGNAAIVQDTNRSHGPLTIVGRSHDTILVVNESLEESRIDVAFNDQDGS
jgi:hypothetical protein